MELVPRKLRVRIKNRLGKDTCKSKQTIILLLNLLVVNGLLVDTFNELLFLLLEFFHQLVIFLGLPLLPGDPLLVFPLLPTLLYLPRSLLPLYLLLDVAQEWLRVLFISDLAQVIWGQIGSAILMDFSESLRRILDLFDEYLPLILVSLHLGQFLPLLGCVLLLAECPPLLIILPVPVKLLPLQL